MKLSEHIVDYPVKLGPDLSASDLDFSHVDTTHLVIKGRKIDMTLVQYPSGLHSLVIHAHTVIPAPVPTTLTSLSVTATEDFEQNFTDVARLHLPDTLEKLHLYGFHLTSSDHVLPSSLTELTFGGDIFAHQKLPPHLKKLCLYGNPYGADLMIGLLPEQLEELTANSYKGVLYILGDYPKSLKKLKIGSHKPHIRSIVLSTLPNLEEADTFAYSIPIRTDFSSDTKYNKWTRNGDNTPYVWESSTL